MKTRSIKYIIVALALGTIPAAGGQERGEQVFNMVPAHVRAKLVERLREYVEFLPTFAIDLTLKDGDPPTYGITGREKKSASLRNGRTLY